MDRNENSSKGDKGDNSGEVEKVEKKNQPPRESVYYKVRQLLESGARER
jgi:hypothetical protein